MNYFYKPSIVIICSALLGACASPTVVQAVKPNDSTLTCLQLQNEYTDAENLKNAAGEEKGVTGGNVARLLFWPSIIGTYMNANEAIAAADNRKVHLANLMSQKNCPIPAVQQATSDKKGAGAAQGGTAAPQTKEEKLAELKKMYDANLISKDVYSERQKAILDAPN